MNELQRIIDELYDEAKRGRWERVLQAWGTVDLARQCSRYHKAHSDWTFLHQAAYWGHEVACRELIRAGAPLAALSRERQTAADVAAERKHVALVSLLRRASESAQSVWEPPNDANLLPSSSLWGDGQERRASEVLRVAYAGGVVTIPVGARYFVDSFERTLIGWHGTYDPPCGMDGEPMA
jgi:hypothetical protein